MNLPFKLKLKIFANGIRNTFSYPSYFIVAFVGFLLALGISLWSLNIELLRFVLVESGLDPVMKLQFFLSIYQSLFAEVGSAQSFLLLIFSVLIGLNLAIFIFVAKRRLKQQRQLKGNASSLAGLILATIAGSCAACGTSLLAPLLASLGITSIVFVQNVGVVAALLGIMLVSYAVYKVGLVAASFRD